MIEITHEGQVILLIAFAVTLVSSLVTRAFIDRDKMKKLREEMKQHQEKIKEATKSKDTKALQKHQEEFMKLTMEQMSHSFKPMIITIIPILLIFGWVRANYGDIGSVHNVTLELPLLSRVSKDISISNNGSLNTQDNKVVWNLGTIPAGSRGSVTLRIMNYNKSEDISNRIIVKYTFKNGTSVQVDENSNSVNPIVFNKSIQNDKNTYVLDINYWNSASDHVVILSGFKFGWVGWYIISAMMISMILNKLLKIT